MIFALILLAVIIMAIAIVFTTDKKNGKKPVRDQSVIDAVDQVLDNQKSIVNTTIYVPEKSSTNIGKYLILDTETTGIPSKSRIFKPDNIADWPYIVQIAWILVDEEGLLVEGEDVILKQDTTIPISATNIHKITTEKMLAEGEDPKPIYESLLSQIQNCDTIVAHNAKFDIEVLKADLYRHGFIFSALNEKDVYCTMENGKEFCITYGKGLTRKNPRLEELFGELFYNNKYITIQNAHSAFYDVLVTYKCFMKMKDMEPPYPIEKKIPVVNEHTYNEAFVSKCVGKIDPEIFKGKIFVITGVFNNFSRDDLGEIFTRLGGVKRGAITSKTNIVIIGENAGPSKLEKIEEQKRLRDDIVVLEEHDLLEMLK